MSSRLSFQSKNNGATKNNSRRSTLPAYYTVQLQMCSAFMFSSLLVVSTSLLLSGTHWYYTDHHKQNKKNKTKTRVDQHTIFFNNRFNITHAFFKKQLLLPPNFKCVVVHMFSTEYTTVPGSYRVPCYSTVVVVEHHKHD